MFLLNNDHSIQYSSYNFLHIFNFKLVSNISVVWYIRSHKFWVHFWGTVIEQGITIADLPFILLYVEATLRITTLLTQRGLPPMSSLTHQQQYAVGHGTVNYDSREKNSMLRRQLRWKSGRQGGTNPFLCQVHEGEEIRKW